MSALMGPVSPEDRGKLAYAVVKQIIRAVKHADSELVDDSGFDNALTSMLAQHKVHLKTHQIDQSHADPYKLGSWFGCALLENVKESGDSLSENEPFNVIGQAVVDSLCGFLFADTGKFRMSVKSRKLLLQMLFEEKFGACEHGIWQNGLYAAFHVAVNYHQSTLLTIKVDDTCP
jgi:hypothetical protein